MILKIKDRPDELPGPAMFHALIAIVMAPLLFVKVLVARYYRKPQLGSVVYNGRTPGWFNPHLTKDEIVLTVGRVWDVGKNAGLLLQREMPAPVCIVGSDRHPENHGSAFAGVRSRNAAQLEPPQDERQLARTMARAAIYAATSRYEPFGLAPLEAALSRCAIVASDIPSFRELWDGAALFFRNNDVESLRQQIARLTDDGRLRRCCANLAYERARQKFIADRMVEDYLNLYRMLVPVTTLAA